MTDLDDLQQTVGEWGAATFPDATDLSISNHLGEELTELHCTVINIWQQVQYGNALMAEEAADCLMLLLHLAHRNGFSLMDETRKKFAVNQTREWTTVAPGGYVKHTDPTP